MNDLTMTKHHGLGNDFLVMFAVPTDPAAMARRVCDRRRGIGADGLLVGEAADGYTARMTLYNADGSRAEMSGNGIRCFAQALAERHGTLDDQLILTDAGDRRVVLTATDDQSTIEASVEMGEIGVLAEPVGWSELACHPDRPVAHLGLGNPHSVVGVDEVAAVDLADLGGKVPHINLEIVEPGPEPTAITMRVHERGAGITEACGTGACAAAFAARSWGLVAATTAEVLVHMKGGTGRVALEGASPTRAVLTGPATFIASVTIPDDIACQEIPAS